MQDTYRELLITKMVIKQKCSSLSEHDLQGKYKKSYEQLCKDIRCFAMCDIQETLNRVLVSEEFKETAHARVKEYIHANLELILSAALAGNIEEYESLLKKMIDSALEGYTGGNKSKKLYSLNFIHEFGLEQKEGDILCYIR